MPLGHTGTLKNEPARDLTILAPQPHDYTSPLSKIGYTKCDNRWWVRKEGKRGGEEKATKECDGEETNRRREEIGRGSINRTPEPLPSRNTHVVNLPYVACPKNVHRKRKIKITRERVRRGEEESGEEREGGVRGRSPGEEGELKTYFCFF